MPITESMVLDALRQVQDPDLRRDIVALGFVQGIEIEGGSVSFRVELTTPACPVKEQLQSECEAVVRALDGVTDVRVEMTAQVRSRKTESADLIPGVKHCVAIASGKGGVGKSTVSVNLAIALAEQGARVGLLDADVYGPSIPMMMGAADLKPLTVDSKIVPIERHGVQMMSIGFLLEEGQAVLWRGPMVAGTLKQLLQDVAWGELDYLLVDLPPGTGDAPMSLAQLAPLTGVVIVSTPNAVAASIAGKAAALFRRLNSPILGVIENMAEYACPSCGTVARIFRGMSGEELATQLKVPYMGSIPIDPSVGECSEEGEPSFVRDPSCASSNAVRKIAGELARQISISSMTRETATSGSADFVAVGQGG
jgi:ATP-binding protein involved in chromosome partitioning